MADLRQHVEYDISNVYQASDRFDGEQTRQKKLTMFDQDKLHSEYSLNANQEKRGISTFGNENNSTNMTQRFIEDEQFFSAE